MGTSFFSKEVLRHLVQEGLNIELVITQTAKPAGRKKQLKPTTVKNFADSKNLKTMELDSIKDEDLGKIKNLKPDLIIVCSFGIIVPEKILELPKLGCVNIHPSLLPGLRGPSPIQTALWQNLSKTGVSFMQMTSKVDAGPVYYQEEQKIDQDDIYPVLEKKLIDLASRRFVQKTEEYINRELKAKEQDEEKVTLTRLITKSDGKVIWSCDAEEIFNKYRAFYGWPSIYCYWQKGQFSKKIIFWEIFYKEENKSKNKEPGEVYKDDDGKVCIQTGKGAVCPLEIQIEGKKSMNIQNFLNGYPDFVGSRLK